MGCCSKIPYRTWIAVVVFFTAWVTYSNRASQSLSITAMVQKSKHTRVPECVRGDSTKNETNDTTKVEDYGPRYDWNEQVQSIVLGSYFYGFFAGALPSGTVAEWVGPYKTISIALSITLGFNIASPFLANIHYGALIGCRIVMGFCNAFIYPAMQVMIARWAPPNEKGRFIGAMMGNMFGNAVTYFGVGACTEHINWAAGYHFVSLEIVLYVIGFLLVVSDYPELNRWITKEEVEFIKTSQEGKITKTKVVPPYCKILTSIPYWAIVLAEYGNLWGIYLQLTGVPKFLVEVVGFKLTNSGLLASLPFLSRMFFGMFFGNLTDWLVKTDRLSKRFIRRFFVLFSHIIPGAMLCLITLVGCNAYFIIALLTISMGLNGASVATHLQNHLELSPNFAGTLYAIHAFIGCTTGFICPAITSVFIAEKNGIKEWGFVFAIGGAFYMLCGVIFIVFASTEVQSWNEKKQDQEEK